MHMVLVLVCGLEVWYQKSDDYAYGFWFWFAGSKFALS